MSSISVSLAFSLPIKEAFDCMFAEIMASPSFISMFLNLIGYVIIETKFFMSSIPFGIATILTFLPKMSESFLKLMLLGPIDFITRCLGTTNIIVWLYSKQWFVEICVILLKRLAYLMNCMSNTLTILYQKSLSSVFVLVL